MRSLPPFADLPASVLERLASALVRVEVPAGTVLIREGEEGDAHYAIAAGQFDVFQDGRFIRRCERGEEVHGTASVIAHTDTTVYKLARKPL
ncbi:MAG: cyclic nucleotide-binding domain-containing protein [Streptosporangiaceae bacterium]